MELKDWAIEFVKARNALRPTLREIEDHGDMVTFVHTHKKHHFLIAPKLRVPEVQDFLTVVCFNTPENRSFLVHHWQDFLLPNLFIIFAHPESNTCWQVNPLVHSLVADASTLEQGLLSMAADVPDA